MKTVSILIMSLLLALGAAGPAFANACSALARAEASKYPGAVVISAQPVTNSQGQLVCRVAIKTAAKDNKPGRVITKTLRP